VSLVSDCTDEDAKSSRPEDRVEIGGLVDLKIQHDVQTELRLPPAAFAIMEHMFAAPDHEIGFTWDGIKAESREVIRRMINAEVVREREYVRPGETRPFRWTIKLTDMGVNVLLENRKRKIVVGQMTPVTVSAKELAEIQQRGYGTRRRG